MRSPVINKYAIVGILAAVLIAVPMSMLLFDEQALFADLNDIYSIATLAGGVLAIVLGAARISGRCGGDLPTEKSAGCITAMAGLVFFYPFVSEFWNMPYSMDVMLFAIAFLLIFAAFADIFAAYTNNLKGAMCAYVEFTLIFLALTILAIMRMESDLIDFSGKYGVYLDFLIIVVSAAYIAISSYISGTLYGRDRPRAYGMAKTAEAFTGPESEAYLKTVNRGRQAEWNACTERAREIQKDLEANQQARAAEAQAARDKANKEAAEKAAAKAAKEAAEKAPAEAAPAVSKDAELIAAKEAAEAEAAKAKDDLQAAIAEAEEILLAEHAAKEAAEAEAAKAKDDLQAAIAEAEEILLAEHAAKEAAEAEAAKAKDDLQAAIAEAEEILLAEHAAKEAAEAEAAKAKDDLQAAIAEAEEILIAEHEAREAAEAEAAKAKDDLQAAIAEAEEILIAEHEAREAAEAELAELKAAMAASEKSMRDSKDVELKAAESVAVKAAAVAVADDLDEDYDDEVSGFDDSADADQYSEVLEDIWTDMSPEALVRRAAWNKGLRCRRNYGPYSIPVAFVKGKVAVFVTHPDSDTSVDSKLESEGWIVIRYNENEITNGLAQGDEVAKAVKAHIRDMKALKKKKKKPVKN